MVDECAEKTEQSIIVGSESAIWDDAEVKTYVQCSHNMGAAPMERPGRQSSARKRTPHTTVSSRDRQHCASVNEVRCGTRTVIVREVWLRKNGMHKALDDKVGDVIHTLGMGATM